MGTQFHRRHVCRGHPGLPAPMEHGGQHSTQRSAGQDHLALDTGRGLHCQVSLQDASCRRHPIPRPQTHLENLGTTQSQDFSLARLQVPTLDRDRRRRHGLEGHQLCYLCDQGQETIDHILVSCPVTREVWFYVLHAFGHQLPQAAPTTLRWWRKLHSLFHGEQCSGFDSLFALISWLIWKERNVRCFREAATSIGGLLHLIKAEADAWIKAGAKGLRALAGA